jgi:mitochondrial import receptor subunit TOM22
MALSESDASSVASVTPDETLYERIAALQDIIPASYRRSVSSKLGTCSSYLKTGLGYGGKTLWVVSTSALLLVVPWALAYQEEQQLAEMDREMQMQQRAGEVRSIHFIPDDGWPSWPAGYTFRATDEPVKHR